MKLHLVDRESAELGEAALSPKALADREKQIHIAGSPKLKIEGTRLSGRRGPT